ncbi:dihydrofolate reductase family protein [Phycicoccus sp. MAQZ13P-2]|uniref:dihydrofolate reductase family protein n=1 Tax=Phycicoccus mangrovi TaxID=2840470 RepID=UPI001BFFE548|nr:dihydrofolate reductase family protein [Phycicoccus mangrovi]MBT9255316.1 dihydrofolate reductase family protein [Phycicoccus mangrovi]MBT9273603.1 dihydrofolate reductase family protein [Phycicoccus mangrovi]
MRQLVVSTFVSLDGVMDSPGGGTHPRAGWTFKEVPFDEAAYEIKGREQEESEALLMGRSTYEEFAPVWPSMDDEFARFNRMQKYVVSTTLAETDPGWQPTTVLRGLDDVARLKEGDGGPILVAGSALLAQGLAAAGLVDRYHLLVFPVVLGTGKRLFSVGPDTGPSTLDLVEHAVYGNGVTLAVYDVRH